MQDVLNFLHQTESATWQISTFRIDTLTQNIILHWVRTVSTIFCAVATDRFLSLFSHKLQQENLYNFSSSPTVRSKIDTTYLSQFLLPCLSKQLHAKLTAIVILFFFFPSRKFENKKRRRKRNKNIHAPLIGKQWTWKYLFYYIHWKLYLLSFI